ncbi:MULTISPECIES: hypothetical protein [unclassified Lentimicrobium]|uniref:hypothetical protein n=1 Tax=unclassified Lentimicrobium TaxID=2677434 RepID=UPI0015570F33|nr:MULTISPECIES: hypothetical protein [unclassified Lentimicrobium]NPD46697.1 hypothetical protein [Lentimicrobium sp. S6]NPD85527.1 hypothetical protein [Lentimicrobium sp. L6]
MRRITIFISTLILMVFIQSCDEKEDINGQWKLMQVETNDGILIPQVDFLVQVEDRKISFNLDVNSCFTEIEIRNDSIIYQFAACSKMCCDGNTDPIGGFLNYSGAYSFINDTLIITNENKYFLVKAAKE